MIRYLTYLRSFHKALSMLAIFLWATFGTTIIYNAAPPMTWPHAEIPYVIQEDPHFTPVYKKEIQIAMNLWSENTPVKFVSRTNEKIYLSIEYTEETRYCLTDFVGYSPFNLNRISINPKGCGIPEITHELGHAMGLHHEHQRPDRSKYVTVHWDCIPVSDWPQFSILPNYLYADTEYDPNSIMHYEVERIKSCPTLTSNVPQYVGPLNTPSALDYKKIQLLYANEIKK